MKLSTNIWLPESDRPVPAVLCRGPYNAKDLLGVFGTSPNIVALLREGYAVVMQDCRGTFASEGTFVPHAADTEDGVDTIAWLMEQEWCDGNIGTWGVSYHGFTQWHPASTGVPGLKAIAPMLSSADLYRAPWYSAGGALSLGTVLIWYTQMSLYEAQRALQGGTGDPLDIAGLAAMMSDPAALAAVTPLRGHPLITKYCPSMIDDVLAHPDRDEAWQERAALDRVAAITTPALHIGGWYDFFIGETLRGFAELKEHAATEDARQGQRLLVGPWSHSSQLGYFRDRRFGLTARMTTALMPDPHLPFFDRWLKGRQDALDGQAPVRIFVMGVDQWRDEQDWPLPDTSYTPYYLDGDGPANTSAGAGTLSMSEPITDLADSYLYDPRRPVPTLGGTAGDLEGFDGAIDQTPLHTRDDVLCFATGVLDEPVEVTGPVCATFFVSSSAVDTDFTAKLVDVHPDGRAIILCEGIQRMRYRQSLAEPQLMTPGEIYEITIDLLATSNVFLPGHRILLEVSSSNFPRYDRNSNTGGVIAEEHESEMATAVNTLHRGPEYPSRIVLPVIDRERA